LISIVFQNLFDSQTEFTLFVDYINFYFSHQQIMRMNFDQSFNLNYQMFFEFYFLNFFIVSSNFSMQNMMNMNDKIVVLQTTIDQFQARMNNLFDLNEKMTIRMSNINMKISWVKFLFFYVCSNRVFLWLINDLQLCEHFFINKRDETSSSVDFKNRVKWFVNSKENDSYSSNRSFSFAF
jgi:hypothetical protein